MTEQVLEEQPRDRKDLKIQALLEKVSTLTTQYENNIADLRVDLTISEENNKILIERLQELESEGQDDVEVLEDVLEETQEKPKTSRKK